MSSTMTATLAATPGPSARITITGIVGAASVQIWRGDGSSEVRVAGDDLQIPAGAVYITDYRLPPGRTITYRAVLYSSLGVITESISATGFAVPPLVDPAMAWVMDPEDPTNAMLLPLMDGTNDQVGHTSAGVAVPPLLGPPIWLGGPRSGLSRVFVISTMTAAEATQFQQIIEPGGQLLIRPGTALRHATGLIYMGAGSIPEAAWQPSEAPADWTIDGTEVADDAWPVVVAERTWLDLEAECATWLDVEAMYATWLAVEQG
jgi:hypothetical protein